MQHDALPPQPGNAGPVIFNEWYAEAASIPLDSIRSSSPRPESRPGPFTWGRSSPAAAHVNGEDSPQAATWASPSQTVGAPWCRDFQILAPLATGC